MSRESLIKDLNALNDFNQIINFKKYPIQDLNAPAAKEC